MKGTFKTFYVIKYPSTIVLGNNLKAYQTVFN